MKVVIPVAGSIYKVNTNVSVQDKPLIPLAGKTVLGFVIEQFLSVGLREFVFIVGFIGEDIKAYIHSHYPEIQAHFVLQNERLGIAHAIHLTQNIIQDEPFLIALGDTICAFDSSMLTIEKNLVFVQKVDSPGRFGVVIIEGNEIVSLAEKPSIPLSNIALVGIYRIQDTASLFNCLSEAVETGKMNKYNNYALTYALEGLLKAGKKLYPFRVQNWLDGGTQEGLLYANHMLLKKNNSQLIPNVNTHSNIVNSVFIPPVSIPAQCKIKNSVVGPFVSVGDGIEIYDSILQNSIAGAGSWLEHVVLRNSVIGSATRVKGRANVFHIGDNTNIEL